MQIFLTDARTFISFGSGFFLLSGLKPLQDATFSVGLKSRPSTFERCRAKAPALHLDPNRRLDRLLVAIDDAAARQIVGRKLDCDAIASENADKILAHLAGDMGEHLMLVFQLDPKHGIE